MEKECNDSNRENPALMTRRWTLTMLESIRTVIRWDKVVLSEPISFCRTIDELKCLPWSKAKWFEMRWCWWKELHFERSSVQMKKDQWRRRLTIEKKSGCQGSEHNHEKFWIGAWNFCARSEKREFLLIVRDHDDRDFKGISKKEKFIRISTTEIYGTEILLLQWRKKKRVEGKWCTRMIGEQSFVCHRKRVVVFAKGLSYWISISSEAEDEVVTVSRC